MARQDGMKEFDQLMIERAARQSTKPTIWPGHMRIMSWLTHANEPCLPKSIAAVTRQRLSNRAGRRYKSNTLAHALETINIDVFLCRVCTDKTMRTYTATSLTAGLVAFHGKDFIRSASTFSRPGASLPGVAER